MRDEIRQTYKQGKYEGKPGKYLCDWLGLFSETAVREMGPGTRMVFSDENRPLKKWGIRMSPPIAAQPVMNFVGEVESYFSDNFHGIDPKLKMILKIGRRETTIR